jgi:hypothetical protein
VRFDGRGLRSSLTAGAWIFAANAAGGGCAGRFETAGFFARKSRAIVGS